MPEESNPRTGMLATVRNRRGVITAVEPYDNRDGYQAHRAWSQIQTKTLRSPMPC